MGGVESKEANDQEDDDNQSNNNDKLEETAPSKLTPMPSKTLDEDFDDDDDDSSIGKKEQPANINFHDDHVKYRRWLHDRVEGTSRYNGLWEKPMCAVCYVPVPVAWFPNLLEQNSVMERVGRIGCVDPENAVVRKYLFLLALVCNFTALLLTFVSFLAATHENFGVLRAVSFTRGEFEINEDRGIFVPKSQVDIGLRTVALEDPGSDPVRQILHFSEFCETYVDTMDGVKPNVFMTPEQCHECEEASFPILFSLAISLIFTFPSITTNFLRMWPNYDVNCQKFFGGVVGTISLLSSLYSWAQYSNSCFRNFEQGSVVVFLNFTRVGPDTVITPDNENDFFFIDREWRAGFGLAFVVIATLLKGVDSVCNWIVPTPRITRDRNEQRAYEYLTAQGRSVSAFERLHQQHRAREEIHHGFLVTDKKNVPHDSLVYGHRRLGIPEPDDDQGKEPA